MPYDAVFVVRVNLNAARRVGKQIVVAVRDVRRQRLLFSLHTEILWLSTISRYRLFLSESLSATTDKDAQRPIRPA